MSHRLSPAALVKGRAQPFLDCNSNLETAVAMTLFNTPSEASSHDQETHNFPTPHSVVCSLLGSPTPYATPGYIRATPHLQPQRQS